MTSVNLAVSKQVLDNNADGIVDTIIKTCDAVNCVDIARIQQELSCTNVTCEQIVSLLYLVYDVDIERERFLGSK